MVGIEDEGQTGEAICPNCGKRGLDDGPSIECGGDRVLVEKFLYEFRRPRRWEVAVFHFPGEPSQAYVKRVVGLPGESIRINGGDVFVNDRIARKSLAEIRAMRMLVHDSRFQPQDAARFPRWLFRSDAPDGTLPRAAGSATAADSCIDTGDSAAALADDWLVYKHWDSGRGGYGTMTDFHGYNGNEPRELNEIKDVGMEARITAERVDRVDLGRASVGLRSIRAARSRPRTRGEIELLRNGQPVPIANRSNPFLEKGLWPRTVLLEAAVMDGRFQAAIDGRLLFEPFDYDDPASTGATSESPLELGVRGGAAEVSEIRDLSRHLLHGHAGQHAAAASRDAVRREARRRRVLRAGRQ